MSEHPKVGDWALHKNNRLDARQVTKVSKDGKTIWIQVGEIKRVGPLWAKYYTFSNPNESESRQ